MIPILRFKAKHQEKFDNRMITMKSLFKEMEQGLNARQNGSVEVKGLSSKHQIELRIDLLRQSLLDIKKEL